MSTTQPPLPRFELTPLPDSPPELAGWLGALVEARARTTRLVQGLTLERLDAPPATGINTVGMLLYHIAGAEMTWVYKNLQEQAPPPALAALLPHPVWEEDSLGQAQGWDLANYLHRLQVVRDGLLATYRAWPVATLTTPLLRQGWRGPYEVTPLWILHHLLQHEAEHRGHIGLLLGDAAPV